MDGIYFPGMHIFFKKVISEISIFKLEITMYAVIITLGFILALLVASKEGKRTGQNEEDYLDFFLVMIIPTLIGLRLYYVLFNLDRFIVEGKSAGQIFLDMINIRNGGLAVYGGLIAGTLTGFIFAKVKKINFPLFGDCIALGVLVGQILGRWGNFFNREAFGDYTSSIFRMAIPVDYYSKGFMNHMIEEGIITQKMLDNQEIVNGVSCITVHPTFLYEGVWNAILLIALFLYRKHKKFDGELAMLYVAGYGVGRFWVEALRTDSLMIGPLKVSQVVAVICVILAVGVIIYNRRNKDTVKTSEEKTEENLEKKTEVASEK